MGVQIIVTMNRFAEIAGELPGRTHDLAVKYASGSLLPAADPPVETGALKASGHVEDRGQEVAVVWTGGAVNRSGEARVYAAYVELGTRFTRAQPYAAPAAAATFPGGVYALANNLVS